MELRDIRYEVRDAIAWVTLNKPEKLNAMSWGSWSEMEQCIAAANADDEVRCVVITGEGRGFCAGTDLTGQGTEDQWPARPRQGRVGRVRSRFLATADIYHCKKPTVAGLNGVAAGAGFSLAISTDIRFASDQARLTTVFRNRGIVADTGSTWLLPRIVGPSVALDLMYTARMVNAQEALRIGLVNFVVPHEEFREKLEEYARSIAHGPSIALELDKSLVQTWSDRSLEDQVEREQFLQQAYTQGSEDAREGRMSFLEKRDPVFRGR
jgi:2-(1,2-epoxy-1,2-dihydrophenyl)acetyl-CoA isomerase